MMAFRLSSSFMFLTIVVLFCFSFMTTITNGAAINSPSFHEFLQGDWAIERFTTALDDPRTITDFVKFNMTVRSKNSSALIADLEGRILLKTEDGDEESFMFSIQHDALWTGSFKSSIDLLDSTPMKEVVGEEFEDEKPELFYFHFIERANGNSLISSSDWKGNTKASASFVISSASGFTIALHPTNQNKVIMIAGNRLSKVKQQDLPWYRKLGSMPFMIGGIILVQIIKRVFGNRAAPQPLRRPTEAASRSSTPEATPSSSTSTSTSTSSSDKKEN